MKLDKNDILAIEDIIANQIKELHLLILNQPLANFAIIKIQSVIKDLNLVQTALNNKL